MGYVYGIIGGLGRWSFIGKMVGRLRFREFPGIYGIF